MRTGDRKGGVGPVGRGPHESGLAVGCRRMRPVAGRADTGVPAAPRRTQGDFSTCSGTGARLLRAEDRSRKMRGRVHLDADDAATRSAIRWRSQCVTPWSLFRGAPRPRPARGGLRAGTGTLTIRRFSSEIRRKRARPRRPPYRLRRPDTGQPRLPRGPGTHRARRRARGARVLVALFQVGAMTIRRFSYEIARSGHASDGLPTG